MNISFHQRISIAWAARRVDLLDNVERYEDSYAVSQEFCEWSTSLNIYPEVIKATTLMVPNFQKE